MGLSGSLQSSKFFFSFRNISFFIIFINERWNMWGKSLSDPIFFNIEKLIEVDWVINPLRLDVFFCFLLNEILSVSNNMSDICIIFSQRNCTSIGKNNVFKGVTRNFSAEIEMESVEQKMFILLMFVNKFLINLILLVIIIIFSSNFLEVITLVSRDVTFLGRIFETNTWVKFKVNKLHQDDVEIQKCCHNSIIDI